MQKQWQGGMAPLVEDLGGGTYVPLMKIMGQDPGQGNAATTDRELVVSTYRCKSAFAGASAGDTITATQVIDVSGQTPSTVSTIWRNQTTAADLASAPSAANLELSGSSALTLAQLLAAGLATDAALGTDGASPPEMAGTGVRGWLRAIFERQLTVMGTDGASPPAIAGTGARGWLRAIYEVLSGKLTTVPSSVSVTGTLGAPGASVELVVSGQAGAVISASASTWSGTTINLQGFDGLQWISLTGVTTNQTQQFSTASNLTSSTSVYVACGGLQKVRAYCASYGGNVVSLNISAVTSPNIVYAMLPSAINITGTVGITAPSQSNDVSSSVLTTSTTTSSYLSGSGTSYQICIPVTVVTGTNATLDVVVQESDDGGTSWFDVYHFPRITAAGAYRSPTMLMTGRSVRYVQTVGGSSPAFTRSISRTTMSVGAAIVRSFIDRAIDPNTAGAAGTGNVVDGTRMLTLVVTSGAGATAAPVYGVQISSDKINWADTGVSLSVPAASCVTATVSACARFARPYIKTAGAGATQVQCELRAIS